MRNQNRTPLPAAYKGYKYLPKHRHYLRDDIEQALRNKARQFVLWLFPHAILERNRAYIGNVYGAAGQSLLIDLSQPSIGRWYDFATGDCGGDFIGLYMANMRYNNDRFVKALSELSSWAGVSNLSTELGNHQKRLVKARKRKRVDIGPAVASWGYHTPDGEFLCKVSRHEYTDHNGRIRKEFIPRLTNGEYRMPSPRIPYNANLIRPGAKLVLCEGEKAADAITAAGYVGTTIMGGARAIQQTDYSVLSDCDVILWRDNDEAGEQWQADLIKILPTFNVTVTGKVTPPPCAPIKWDAADTSEEHIKNLIGKFYA